MIIKRSFYDRNTVKVAKELLGCFLVRKYKNKIIKAMIMETEAYRGHHDLASHASRGKTERNKIMFGHPGHAYIYFVYGMHYMLNIVTEEKDFPAAVLIRRAEIISPFRKGSTAKRGGICKTKLISQIPLNPPFSKGETIKLNGPAKLTKYFHINKSLNGLDLTKGEKIWLEYPENKIRLKIVKSPRIGVDYAKHCKEWKWNFRIVEK